MPLTPAQMDELMDRHFAFEMADDVDGVLATLAHDAEHDIVGAANGPTIGLTKTRPTYEQVFTDLAGDRVETLHRYYGDNTLTDESLWSGRAVGNPLGIPGRNRSLQFRILHVIEFDETGLITRENVWLDYPRIAAQLADDPPNTQTNEHPKKQNGQPQ
jgi:hypothetical protein